MATTTTANLPAGPGDVVCPDPSMHSKPASDNPALKGALLASSPSKSQKTADGKLSAASAATSLKYAKAQDLPGFPVVGIDTASSGQKAATLANQNKSTFEHWKPELSASASKAALLAAKDGGKLDLWQPESTREGSSAAGMAMHKNLSPHIDRGFTDEGKRNSLLAATKSISGSTRRPEPAPVADRYPDSKNATLNALSAATSANKGTRPTSASEPLGSESMEAARVTHLHMSREMFTEHPPVAPEVEEKRYNDALRASAVSMARQMMEAQKKEGAESTRSDAGDLAAKSVHNKHMSTSSIGFEDYTVQATKYIHLQEAAQKLAAERLAKLDPDGVAAYREHYGYSLHSPPRSRISRRLGRRQESADDDDDSSSDDEWRANRIRGQMNAFNQDVAAVDEKKRQNDRDNLLAAAQKRVQARMQDMDQKVFAETGHASPAMMEDWEAKAKAKAAADSEKRMTNHGKVHIGGGKYMDQSEIEAIAASRMQPTLDEINDSAEKKRARDEEIRLDQERRKYEAEQEKKLDAERKAELKRAEEERKLELRNEKFRLAQEKRMAKEAEKEEKRQKKSGKILYVPKGESPLAAGATAATIPGEPGVGTLDSAEPASAEGATETATPERQGSKLRGLFGKLRSVKKSSDRPAAAETPISEPELKSDEVTDEETAAHEGTTGAEDLTAAKTGESTDLYTASEPEEATKDASEPAEETAAIEDTPKDTTEPDSKVDSPLNLVPEEQPSAETEGGDEARDTFDESKAEIPRTSAESTGAGAGGSKFREEV